MAPPTCGDTIPAQASAAEIAPTTHGNDQPVSATMGAASTAIR
ncbi:hypothetical protein [Falsirhodobacter xinxiangensis]|nr:hypothetical protein [Rhodobacter xinxiangensis]